MNVKVKARLRLSQVDEEGISPAIYEISRKQFSDKLKETIKDEIKSKLISAENHFKQHRYDVVGCAETFHKFRNSEYRDYVSQLSAPIDFIQNVHFTYEVDIEQRR